MSGFIITITSNNKWWYLLGTILFLALGIILAIVGFTGGNTTLGIAGIVVGVVSCVFVVDALKNL
ncbi:MAG: hypothetical protein HY080_17440 [Gammaproteobacteria bacterium]|nr:hypothetical protein [Gammaproteobacteria bacterium]